MTNPKQRTPWERHQQSEMWKQIVRLQVSRSTPKLDRARIIMKRIAPIVAALHSEIHVCGEIDSELANKVVDRIDRAGRRIRVLINSRGGQVDAMNRIISKLRQSAKFIETIATGECASAAAFLFCAGHWRRAAPTARFMFHGLGLSLDPEDRRFSNAATLRRLANILERDSDEIFARLQKRINFSSQQLAAIRAGKDVILTAAEAKGIRLVHGILE